MVHELGRKLAEARQRDPSRSAWSLLSAAIAAGFRILVAKIYLRTADSIGKRVSVNGKPLIRNSGVMVFGNEVRIWSNTVRAKLITGPKGRLTVGTNSRINGAHIYAGELVKIGNHVRIAPYTIILDSDFHDVNDHFSDGVTRPVIIGDHAWIATRATILKGVRIGEGAVVAAGAVVTKDVEPYTLVAGVPARFVKRLSGKS